MQIAYYQKFVDEHSKNQLKQALIAYDRTLLVADSRRCEPKKFGGPGARARYQVRFGNAQWNDGVLTVDAEILPLSACFWQREKHKIGMWWASLRRWPAQDAFAVFASI